METLPADIQNHFRRFFFSEETADQFSQWLYSCKAIESVIGSENYLSLLEVDYRHRDGQHKAQQIVLSIYGHDRQEQLFIDQAISIAENMLDGSMALDEGCRKLAHISADGHGFVDRVFVGYADEFDRLGATGFYDERIIESIHELLAYCRQSTNRAV